MSDLPPDLLRLRTLETWTALQLDRIREAIREAEIVEAAERRLRDAVPPPVPDWEAEVSAMGSTVHVGGCALHGGRVKAVGIDQARRLLVEGAEACPACRPDTALGLLD